MAFLLSMLSFYQGMTGLIGLTIFCITLSARAEGEPLSAADLAARLSSVFEDGDSLTRLRLKIKTNGGGKDVVMQVQVKARHTAEKTDVLYQVLWPKDRKGQAFLIHQKGGGGAKGVSYDVATKKVSPLNQSKMKGALLGSDLAYQDVLENFFRWGNQSLVGKETIDRAECLILESKPDAKDSTPYSKVKSWVDIRRLVALRVEKYDAAGKLIRKIETTRVAKDDTKNYIPASLLITRPGSNTLTEVEGSNIRHDVKFSDKDFTTGSLNDFRVPR